MSADAPQSDADLLRAVRAGNAAAYGELYERHVTAARAMARQLVRGVEVEDVVAEAFTKILDLVCRGGGPESAFRTYLLTIVRRTVHDRTRIASSPAVTGEIERYDPTAPFVDPTLAGLDRSPIARAYLSLPERWRAVLWHTEVERGGPAQVAPLLGLSANGVAALSYRAREGLRQAYLRSHARPGVLPECRTVLGRLGHYVRGGLSRRDARTVDEHVDSCQECHGVLVEVADVERGLRVVVGPLIAGPLFSGYVLALAKASGPGGAGPLRAVRRLGRMPRRWLVGAGAVVLLVVAAATVRALSGPEPVDRPATLGPVAVPPPSVDPVPVPLPTGRPSRVPGERASRVPPPVAIDRQSTPAEVAEARLRVTIDPIGSLVRARPGIVGVRLRNYGKAASDELAARVGLPPGVSLVPHVRSGPGASVSGPAGTVDGWECRPSERGARCVRRGLAAGRSTALYLRVLVSGAAPQGAGPTVRVDAGRLRVRARAASGVRATGAPARFATEGKVSVRAIGNTLLTCPDDLEGCPEARRREGEQRDNDLWHMTALDRDDHPFTDSSSEAVLSVPRGGQVVWAGLYWSAAGAEGGPIRLRPPGLRGYVTVRPSEVKVRELPLGPVYQAFADVTALAADVRAGGTWWAADAPMEEGVARHAGWSLVLVVTDPAEPYGQAVVLDGGTVVGGRVRRAHFPLHGLRPAAAPARVELVTWEGDADLRGDRVSLGSGALTPSGGERDASNVFDGSVGRGGGLTFGVDVDTVSAELGVDPGLTITSDKDVVLFGAAAVSVRSRP
ncbi:sigma-70 family RNA polymerase sigma factor [Nonomuraea maritima]|uniref:sigma-70 family RNA polymerase sigma factor n=1 Tax=Nonomuraea maritima TaxID=683260 RepID=UPI00371631F2